MVKWNKSGRDANEYPDEELSEQFEQCDYIGGPMVGENHKHCFKLCVIHYCRTASH